MRMAWELHCCSVCGGMGPRDDWGGGGLRGGRSLGSMRTHLCLSRPARKLFL